jgi:hypothetical protein
MRSYKISSIIPSTSEPSIIVLDSSVGDVSAYFHGKVWVSNDYSSIYPFYESGDKLIVATTFDITGNSKFNGTYTVYTSLSASDYQSTVFDGAHTKIRIQEALDTSASGTDLTDGSLVNFSTYVFTIAGQSPLVIYEGQSHDPLIVTLLGKYKAGWAEQFMQSMINISQHGYGSSPPANPVPGQFFVNSADQSLSFFNGTSWVVPNTATAGQRVIIHQTVAQSSWTLSHGLGLAAPYIAETQFFVNTSNGVKAIIPQDITFTDSNTITVTFSNAESGYAIIRG